MSDRIPPPPPGFILEKSARDPSGNAIDLSRPRIENSDGSFSTERTIGIEADGKYFNIPTIMNGRQLTEDQAVDAFMRGENKPVGIFNSQAEADAAAAVRSEKIGEIRARGTGSNQHDVRVADGPAQITGAVPPPPEGFVLEGTQPAAAKVGYGEDMARSGLAGLSQGATGLADLVLTALRPPNTIADLQTLSRGEIPERRPMVDATRRGAAALSDGMSEYEPQTTPGKYARTAAEFIPGAAAFGGLSPSNLMRFGALPGLTSEGAGQLTEGTAAEPYARFLGALLGPAVPSIAKRAVTPFPASAERKAMVDALRNEGVTVTAGQATGRNSLRNVESELGGGKAAQMMEAQGEQFTAAALKRAGIKADRASPEVLDDAFSRIGKQFDNLAAKTTVPLDKKLQNDMLDAVVKYQSVSANSAPAVEQIMNRTAKLAAGNGGKLAGEAYKNIRSEIGDLISRADGPTQQALRDMQHVLDDAVGRHMPQEFMKDWKAVRSQYRNLLVIENAATRAGSESAMGIISPSALRSATVNQGKRAYARGQGDFADLARAGEAILKPLPNSGTAGRQAARALGTGIPTILGGGAGAFMTGGPMGAMAGSALGATLPPMVGRALLSGPMRSYLGNQMTNPQSILDPRYMGTLSTLLGQNAR